MAKRPFCRNSAFRLFLGVFPILFGIWLFVTERLICDDKVADDLHVWLQFLTTNWPNWQTALPRQTVWFSIAVSIRFALAYALIGGVWATFAQLLTWRKEHTMKYADALRFRDHAIELEILNILPQEGRDQAREMVRKAIEDASKHWETEHLPSLIGPELAREFVRRLHEEQIGQ
jgi:hypothetical protein